MFDPVNNIALLTPDPDFQQMAYASIDDMVADAWISPEAVKLKLPVALAAGFQIVTRARATDNTICCATSFQRCPLS